MKSLHIRNLDDAVIEGLKRRARRHHRPLQKEVAKLLSDAATMIPPDARIDDSPLSKLYLVSSKQNEGTWSRSDIYDTDGR